MKNPFKKRYQVWSVITYGGSVMKESCVAYCYTRSGAERLARTTESNPEVLMEILRSIQDGKPIMVDCEVREAVL